MSLLHRFPGTQYPSSTALHRDLHPLLLRCFVSKLPALQQNIRLILLQSSTSHKSIPNRGPPGLSRRANPVGSSTATLLYFFYFLVCFLFSHIGRHKLLAHTQMRRGGGKRAFLKEGHGGQAGQHGDTERNLSPAQGSGPAPPHIQAQVPSKGTPVGTQPRNGPQEGQRHVLGDVYARVQGSIRNAFQRYLQRLQSPRPT